MRRIELYPREEAERAARGLNMIGVALVAFLFGVLTVAWVATPATQAVVPQRRDVCVCVDDSIFCAMVREHDRRCAAGKGDATACAIMDAQCRDG